MSGETPINVAGVVGFPTYEGDREIRFIDSAYNQLFSVPDGENIILTTFGGDQKILPCRYIDDYHAVIGKSTFHICEYAELQEHLGAVYAPEHPRKWDVLDTYSIYQIQATHLVPYAFQPYEEAVGKLRLADYRRAYQGVLARNVTLEDLYLKHNRSSRPFWQQMRSLSMSDVVVLDRGGKQKAYYMDRIGFQEVKRFLHPPVRKRKPPAQER